MTEDIGTRLWCDTETTGLHAHKGAELMQIGAVITDDNLKELGSFEILVGGADLTDLHPATLKMHTDSGLLAQYEKDTFYGTIPSLAEAEKAFREFINSIPSVKDGLTLSNNTVSFDQRFLQAYMPGILEMLHYRTIDVSTLRRTFRDETNGEVDPGKPECPHTALGDARVCIQEYKSLFARYDEWVIEQHLANKGED